MRALRRPSRPLPGLPRKPLAALALAACLGASCACPPTSSDWLAVGFRSPRQTFESFVTAFGGDQLDLEYRCFSSGFRRANGVTQSLYRKFRRDLIADKPWLKKLSCAEAISVERLSEDRARVNARVESIFATVDFRVDLVREDYWELWREDERADDDVADFSALVRQNESGEWLVGAAPVTGAVPPAEVTELRIGREWKIDAVELADDSSVSLAP